MNKNEPKRRDLLTMAVRRVFDERVAPAVKERSKQADKLEEGQPAARIK